MRQSYHQPSQWEQTVFFNPLDVYWVSRPVVQIRGLAKEDLVPVWGLVVVFKAHRLLYHSTLGLRVKKKKKRVGGRGGPVSVGGWPPPSPFTHLRLQLRNLPPHLLLPKRSTVQCPLSSEYGTYKTVQARFWSWFSGGCHYTVSICSLFARKRFTRTFHASGSFLLLLYYSQA